jgi:hypothetical protein
MRKPKTYSVREVYDSTLIGFVFEFFSSKQPSFIVEDLQQMLRKNVVITGDVNINPTYTSAILLKEYEGKRPRYQFKVGFQKYSEIPTFLNTILFWINENASLDNSTLLRVNLDYDFKELSTLNSISNMDVGKLILRMNENFIHERFEEMKDNPFALSIKKLIPFNMSVNASNVVNLKNQFKIPNSIFYGIDLTEQTRGLLTFNYIGGPKYSEKVKEIYEILEYYILTTYQVLNSHEYSTTEVNELNRLTEEFRIFRKCYYDPKRFLETYKDITIFIDLNKNPALVETQWFQLRDVVAKLILESGITKCKFNWDTEVGAFQIKDAEIRSSLIKGFQIIDSKIVGVIEDCGIWQSEIKDSRLVNSILVNENKVSNSYLQNVRADRDNKIEESFIENEGEIINCKVFNSILKNVSVGNLAKLDEHCLVINPKVKDNEPSRNGLDVSEVRDYKWIKSLRDPNYKDTGYGNEYKEE